MLWPAFTRNELSAMVLEPSFTATVWRPADSFSGPTMSLGLASLATVSSSTVMSRFCPSIPCTT